MSKPIDPKTFENYLSVLGNSLDDYVYEHPHWKIEVLVSLIKWGIKSLRHYIESSSENQITWENPFLDLPYAVDWDWEKPREGDVTQRGMVIGTFTRKNTATKKIAARTISEILVRRLNTLALGDLTNDAWYEVKDNYYLPCLPLELNNALVRIKDTRARREAFENIVRPFAIGAALIDYSDMEMKSGASVSEAVANQLANINQMLDIQRIGISGDVNGRNIEASLIFQIHPLVANYDKKRACHTITIGLGFEREIQGEEIVSKTPANWPRKDREMFWDELLQSLDKLTDLLIPKVEREESEIISINAQIKVPKRAWHPANRSAEIKKITDALSQSGELEKFSFESTNTNLEQRKSPACAVCSFVHDAGFTQFIVPNQEPLLLAGVAIDILRLVHEAHEKGFNGLSTKDDRLLKACGGYGNPCKAFNSLKRSESYKLIFDTSRRGFISLRAASGMKPE